MAIPLLRKMTRKSTLKFGQYRDNTVQECLTFYRYNYLRWVYFNCLTITFMDDILDEIGITEEYRIEKPGIDEDKFQILFDAKREKMSGLNRYIMDKKVKKNEVIKHRKIRNSDWKRFTKPTLTRKNQGKL